MNGANALDSDDDFRIGFQNLKTTLTRRMMIHWQSAHTKIFLSLHVLLTIKESKTLFVFFPLFLRDSFLPAKILPTIIAGFRAY